MTFLRGEQSKRITVRTLIPDCTIKSNLSYLEFNFKQVFHNQTKL